MTHDTVCTPSTLTHPPGSPATPIHAVRALSIGSPRSTPSAQLRTLLNSLVSLLQREYTHVFNDNLGVQSGEWHEGSFGDNCRSTSLQLR